ncbi:MAG: hypothetical protein EG826_12095 [Deltaproteobacteria bacterium]|nr:hypothetical protein [Deltaproteobacteria bacterium]
MKGKTFLQPGPIGKIFRGLVIGGVTIAILGGCESGDKVIDEATGNRALKQYQATKETLNTIDAQQKERHKALEENEAAEKRSD